VIILLLLNLNYYLLHRCHLHYYRHQNPPIILFSTAVTVVAFVTIAFTKL
jgi:hypothetical protein